MVRIGLRKPVLSILEGLGPDMIRKGLRRLILTSPGAWPQKVTKIVNFDNLGAWPQIWAKQASEGSFSVF